MLCETVLAAVRRLGLGRPLCFGGGFRTGGPCFIEQVLRLLEFPARNQYLEGKRKRPCPLNQERKPARMAKLMPMQIRVSHRLSAALCQ